ncbi:MAG TPA: DUF1259 domain-containing protein [Gemmatimonadaceae bacterium]
MRRMILLIGGALLGCSANAADDTTPDDTSPAGQRPAIDWARVDSALGRTGIPQPGEMRRYGMPRGDLRVTAAGVPIRPAFALGSWIAFKAHGTGAVAMGDLVLLHDELAPVLSKLQEGGVEQTAIHHHIIQESPRILYVHVHGHGDPVAIAATVRAALALTGTPDASPPSAASAEAFGIDTAAITATLGHGGRLNGGVWQVNVPRTETIRSGDFEVPPSMGLGTVINFQPTGGGKAAITGDFVLTASEVNPVIKALSTHRITVTSLHNHLLDDTPRLFFMHFWANDDAVTLARGLRAALELTNSQAPSR